MPTVLVVDDDPHIREVLRFALEKDGHRVVEAADGQEALARFAAESPELLVLDVVMPEMDGIEACRRLRAESSVPILFLSSKDDEIDRILGLEMGGDDYVTKPFSPRELVARIRALLRRAAVQVPTAGAAEGGEVLTQGRLRLDGERFEVSWDGEPVVLTVTEFGLLRTLMKHPGRVSSRQDLMDRAYREHTVVTERTIDTHVRRLRQKFAAVGGHPVETVHGLGYKLGDCEGSGE
ncbi:MAG: response regulator transcription factor [Acidobacteriota bacterium]